MSSKTGRLKTVRSVRLLHCTEPANRNFNTSVVISCPSSIHCVYTAAHECTIWTQQEDNYVCYLLRRTLPLESTWFVKRRIRGPAAQVPVFLHQRCVDRAWSHGVHSDLARAILLSSRFRQPNNTVLARIVCSMPREP